MDTRDNSLYRTREDAIAAGVPPEVLAPIDDTAPFEGDRLVITSGPFKGREYRRQNGQLKRIK